jgi:hypothetical protein
MNPPACEDAGTISVTWRGSEATPRRAALARGPNKSCGNRRVDGEELHPCVAYSISIFESRTFANVSHRQCWLRARRSSLGIDHGRNCIPFPAAFSRTRVFSIAIAQLVATPLTGIAAWFSCATIFAAVVSNDCRSVELRALCNEVPRTPPGPEGSNGTGITSCAPDHPKFLAPVTSDAPPSPLAASTRITLKSTNRLLVNSFQKKTKQEINLELF